MRKYDESEYFGWTPSKEFTKVISQPASYVKRETRIRIFPINKFSMNPGHPSFLEKYGFEPTKSFEAVQRANGNLHPEKAVSIALNPTLRYLENAKLGKI